MSNTQEEYDDHQNVPELDHEQVLTTDMKTDHMIGQVKWFNNKAGYGFITITDTGNNESKDIFAHYSTIQVADSEHQYRYLVQGEYVEFDLSTSTNNVHEYQATNISGIKGGKLMCEARQNHYTSKREVVEKCEKNDKGEISERTSKLVKHTSQTNRREKNAEFIPIARNTNSNNNNRRDNNTQRVVYKEKDNDGFQPVHRKKKV